jgi:hypothetical protein
MHMAKLASDNQGRQSEVIPPQVAIDAQAKIVGSQFGGDSCQKK